MLRVFVCLSLATLASAMAQESPFQEPQGDLTLGHALATALQHSPTLVSYPTDLRIEDARIQQAGLRPNPELSLEAENLGLGGRGADTSKSLSAGIGSEGVTAALEREREGGTGSFDEAEITLSLSQTIELGGKRTARIVAAKGAKETVGWDYEVARAEVAGDTYVRFMELLAAQENARQQREAVALAEHLTSSVHATVEAGDVSPLDGRRADAELERARIRQRELERGVEQARLRLAATWGSSAPAFNVAVGDLSKVEALPSLEALLASRAAHPATQRWAAELAEREARLALERAQRVPDMTLRLGYRRSATGASFSRGIAIGTEGIGVSRMSGQDREWDNSVVVEASIPLPLFHRNQGNIREAELMVERAGEERRAWDKTTEASLSERHAVAAAAEEKFSALNSRVLPDLEKTLALTREGYTQGKFGLVSVLDAQRATLDVRAELLEAQVAYHLALADIEQITGGALAAAATENAASNDSEKAHE